MRATTRCVRATSSVACVLQELFSAPPEDDLDRRPPTVPESDDTGIGKVPKGTAFSETVYPQFGQQPLVGHHQGATTAELMRRR